MNNVIHLKDIISLITKGTTPKVYSSESKNTIKFIRVNNITKSGRIDTSEMLFIDNEQNELLKRSILKENDILYSIAGAIGRSAVVEKKHLPANTNQALGIIRINKLDEYHLDYIKYSLNSEFVQRQAEEETQGGAQPNLNLQQLGNLHFWLPETLSEQKKIAEILTSVDKVIELTEIEIEKLKNLKKGMMQDLLTKGIGHTKFKDSPIGKIPESWEEFEFGSLVSEKLLGITIRGEGVNSIPLVKMGNIKEGRFVYDKLEQVDESVIDSSYLLSKGDLLFNTRNTPEMTGKVAVWRGDYPIATFDNNLLRLRFDKRVNPFFMGNLLTSDAIYLKFRGLVTGSNSVAAIYWKDLSKMRLNLPPIAEQDKITDILLKIENSLEAKIIKNEKLINLKKGLMQDLLTGKVRVKV